MAILMKKYLMALAIGLFVISLFTTCACAQTEAMRLKLGHVLAPGTAHHVAATKLSELVKERTNNAIIIDVYPSSQLGDEREMLEALQLGTLDFVFSATAPLSAWLPNYLVFDMPFLFDGYEHAYKVYDGEFGKARIKELEQIGIKGLQLTEAGFSNIITTTKPLNVPDDAKGLNIRCMESPGLIAYFNAMGANPVPMAMSEVFTSLQNKTLDGGTWPLLTTYSNKLYTVTKYCTLLDPIPTTCLLAASQIVWDSIPSQYHQVIEDCAREAILYQREYLAKRLTELIAEMEEEGMIFVRPDRNVWKAAIFDKVIAEMVPKYISSELVEAVIKERK